MECPRCRRSVPPGAPRCLACGTAQPPPRPVPPPPPRPVAAPPASTPSTDGLGPGVLLRGRWRVGPPLGDGAMATVYRAEDASPQRLEVVVKVPHAHLLEAPRVRACFEAEVRQHARFSHANIVPVLDAGEHEGVPFFVLPYLGGGDLDAWLEDSPGCRQTFDEVLHWLPGIAAALDALHATGVVHRDVKPSNILFDDEGVPHLSDFGVSQALGSARWGSASGELFGTPLYFAPEQALGPAVGPAADQYALATTVYEALAGARPFWGDSVADVVRRKREEDPLPLSAAAPDLPAAVVRVVHRALARDPAARFPTCMAFVTALCAAAAPATPAPSEAGAAAPAVAPPVPAWAKVSPAQIAAARAAGVPVAFENGIGMRFVLVPAGTFAMGSPPSEERRGEDETPHPVTLSEAFWLQTTPVTNRQYRRFRPRHGLRASDDPALSDDEQPAVMVSWEDATAFAAWLARCDRARAYRLATEAEWERACRAGTTTPFWWGVAARHDLACYDARQPYGGGPRGPTPERPAPVAAFPPNPWGLHDMHGLVQEWCADWADAYRGHREIDPKGPPAGTFRALRGGSWRDEATSLRSAWRGVCAPAERGDDIGFRIAVSLPRKPAAEPDRPS